MKAISRNYTGHSVGSKVDDVDLLSFYKSPPREEISIDEFENFALDRLQLLRAIEILRSRGIAGKEFKTEVERMERKLVPLRGVEIFHIPSHFYFSTRSWNE